MTVMMVIHGVSISGSCKIRNREDHVVLAQKVSLQFTWNTFSFSGYGTQSISFS